MNLLRVESGENQNEVMTEVLFVTIIYSLMKVKKK